jgi:very-short-patch-repair endonuclease
MVLFRHGAGMEPQEVLRFRDGVASRAELLRYTSRRALDRAVREGQVESAGRGRYALPSLPSGLKTALARRGVLSHESAAKYWLLETVAEPTTVHVTVPPRAHRPPGRGVTLHYAETSDEGVTSPLRTVLDCARTMPFREGLAIVDSALRRDLVTPEELLDGVHRLTNRGHRRALKVVQHGSAAAANPFESVLRAIVIEAGLVDLVPQVQITEDGLNYYVDLGDQGRRIVLEAEGFEFHISPTALERDCRRYDELVSRGWLVLRFTWGQVIFEPEWVRAKLLDTYRLRPYPKGGLISAKGRKSPGGRR